MKRKEKRLMYIFCGVCFIFAIAGLFFPKHAGKQFLKSGSAYFVNEPRWKESSIKVDHIYFITGDFYVTDGDPVTVIYLIDSNMNTVFSGTKQYKKSTWKKIYEPGDMSNPFAD